MVCAPIARIYPQMRLFGPPRHAGISLLGERELYVLCKRQDGQTKWVYTMLVKQFNHSRQTQFNGAKIK